MKNITYNYSIVFYLALSLILVFVSCSRDDEGLEVATFPTNSDVFLDGFTGGLEYLPFGGSKLDAFTVETDDTYEGEAAMRFDIPNVGDPDGAFAGAIFPIPSGRNLTGYNALTFWAKGSQAGTINEIGFGNDFGENKFLVTAANLQLTTNWKKYIIPIPDPSKLTQERGLFWYSEGPEDGKGYSFWIDELQYESLGAVGQPRASIFDGADLARETFIGTEIPITSLQATFNLESGADQTVAIAPAYFTFSSSDPSVATVSERGIITVVGAGSTTITATLDGNTAAGSITLNSIGQFVSAPTPTQDPADVISIFSDAYNDEPVEYYNGFWDFSSTQGGADFEINGDNLIVYSDLNFVGIQFSNPTIDISEMTHFHVDLLIPDELDPGDFLRIGLTDIGDDNSFGGGDDSGQELSFASPTLVAGEWVSLDIPLSDFTGLTSRRNLAQVIFVSDLTIPSISVDNIYFYKDEIGIGGDTEPMMAAPSPIQEASNVISLFSDAYLDVTVDTWRTDWSSTDFEDVTVAGDPTKKYSNLDFVGIETVSNTVDASQMTHVHLDVWSPNITQFGLKIVDFGADGAFDGGDDTEHQIDIVGLSQGAWVSLDIPLSDFLGLTNRANIAQYIIVGQPSGATTIFIDNFYFYGDSGSGGATQPTMAAPTPVQDASNVISLFSDAYSDVTVDTWRTDWSSTNFEDVTVAGDPTKKYSNLDFVGIETVSNTVDASQMTHVHLDVWSPDFTFFGIKLVDFGPDGSFGGDDDSEHQIDIENLNQGEWVSLDILLDDFMGLTNRSNIAQYIIVGQPTDTTTVFIDNFYFYGEGANNATEPTMAAPTPTEDAMDVISLFSDAYTDVAVDTWRTDWSVATFEDVTVGGSATKKYSELDFVGIETVTSTIDATDMTHFRIDVWSADYTFFAIKLVDFGADGIFGGDDTEHQINIEMPEQGTWVTFDIPLSDFAGLTSKGNIAQLILVAEPTGATTVFADNIYFHK